MSFDKNEFYIRSSNVERTIVSTEKELEGFFNKPIKRTNFHIIKNPNFMNLFNLDDKEHEEMEKYQNYCKKRNLEFNYKKIFYTEIFPILEKCYGTENTTHLYSFCDSVYTAYFQYTYGNDTTNKIGKCKENVQKIYDFCYNWFNSMRGWSEYGAYLFYKFYQHIFDYMNNAINKSSLIKMVMIGGHDVTLDKFMDFLDGMKIIPRTHFPHYACNIVIELRKYNNILYLEFYYNDILRYNDTLYTFQNILNNSKYNNLYNYCGVPPWKKISKNETKEDENINTEESFSDLISNNLNEKKENKSQNITITINETKNENNAGYNDIESDKNDIENINKNITKEQIKGFNTTNDAIFISNNKTNKTEIYFEKLKKFLKQNNYRGLFVSLGILFVVIIMAIVIIFWVISKKKKKYSKYIEETQKNNSLSIVSAPVTKIT